MLDLYRAPIVSYIIFCSQCGMDIFVVLFSIESAVNGERSARKSEGH